MPATKSYLESRLRDLERKVDELEERFSATSIFKEIDSVENSVREMQRKGYAYLHSLEASLPDLRSQVESLRSRLETSVKSEQYRLRGEFNQARTAIDHAVDTIESSLSHAEKEVGDIENRLHEAERKLGDILEPLTNKISESNARLANINRYLEARDEASFTFESGENVVLADKAEWVVTGKGGEDPDGVVFLSSKRVIFEQKEKVGKKLGMFGGKQQHEVKWQITLDQIASVATENKGLLGRKDMLTVTLKPGAEHPQLVMEIKSADNKFWREMLEKAIGGQLEQ
jgi:predicted  nucleic acid-binding Zn-ribbon protein